MITIPKTKIWTQTNSSDTQGDIWASFNIDLNEREGKMRVGKRLLVNTNTSDLSDVSSYPIGFKNLGTSKFTVAGSYVLSNNTQYPSAGIYSRVGGGAPTNCDPTISDIAISNYGTTTTLYVSSPTETVYFTTNANGTAWSNFIVGASDTSFSHMMASYNGRTYMSKLGSLIQSWDSSNVVATPDSTYTLQLGNTLSNVITFIKSASDRLWIGTVNTLGGAGYVYEWDGVLANTPTRIHRLDSSGALSCVIKDDKPYIIDTNGAFLGWNGGTFVELDRLNRKNNKNLYNNLSTVNNRFVHPNGMAVIQGKIDILIDGRNYTSNLEIEETIPSGIYEYDTNKGLGHKHSFGLSHASDSIIDYGQIKIAGAGALAEDNYSSTDSARNGTFLAGASYYTDATTVSSAIFYDDSNDTLQKAGSFISTQIQADDGSPYHLPAVENTWNSFYTIYKKFFGATDKIVLKYRTAELDPVFATCTWVSTNQLTTTTDVSSYWSGGMGGEVEVIQGLGSGKCAHITKLDKSTIGATTTYTLTLDETFTGATGTSKIRLQNWKKIGAITSNNQVFNSDTIGQPSTWIQFKVWMLFTGKDEIERFILNNLNTTPAK